MTGEEREIAETLHSIRNRAEIAMYLLKTDAPIKFTIPTLLEDNCGDAQDLALEYCDKEHPKHADLFQ